MEMLTVSVGSAGGLAKAAVIYGSRRLYVGERVLDQKNNLGVYLTLLIEALKEVKKEINSGTKITTVVIEAKSQRLLTALEGLKTPTSGDCVDDFFTVIRLMDGLPVEFLFKKVNKTRAEVVNTPLEGNTDPVVALISADKMVDFFENE